MVVRKPRATENILSDEIIDPSKKKKKARKYSFRGSKRLPLDKMTEVNGIKIPSMPGSCYHAIIAGLAANKDKFCSWKKIIELTHKNIRMYAGEKAWLEFVNKSNVKTYEQRIKENAHTLTRTGKDCYGYRLHELGMCIYYFKDGAILVTGGKLVKSKDGGYDVSFHDGRKLQMRYRGTTMTYREYKRFLDKNMISKTGKILDPMGIKKFRSQDLGESFVVDDRMLQVCVVLEETFNQTTAIRLEGMGVIVEQARNNKLIGMLPAVNVEEVRNDPDVKEVEISG